MGDSAGRVFPVTVTQWVFEKTKTTVVCVVKIMTGERQYLCNFYSTITNENNYINLVLRKSQVNLVNQSYTVQFSELNGPLFVVLAINNFDQQQ